MSYQEIYKGLNKRASNEQIKKLASIIGMRKKAADAKAYPKNKKGVPQDYKVPDNYFAERQHAYNETPIDKAPQFVSPRSIINMPHFNPRPNVRDLPKIREQQVMQTLFKIPGMLPGTKDYNIARKYLLQRGQTNWYNFLNPTEPKEAPAVPKLQKVYPQGSLEDIGNFIVKNKAPQSNTVAV